MADFVAKVRAELDLSHIEDSINLSNKKVVLDNIKAEVKELSLDSGATSSLVSSIQKTLDSSAFKIKVSNIDFSSSGAEGAAKKAGNKVGEALTNSILKKFNANTLNSKIDQVEAKIKSLQKLGSTEVEIAGKSGSSKSGLLDSLKSDLDNLKKYRAEIENQISKIGTDSFSADGLSNSWKSFEDTLSRVNNLLSQGSVQSKNFASAADISKFKSQLDSWSGADSLRGKITEISSELAELGESVPVEKLEELKNKFSEITSVAEIQKKLDLGEFTSDLAQIEAKINSIKDSGKGFNKHGESTFGEELETSLEDLKKAKEEIEGALSSYGTDSFSFDKLISAQNNYNNALAKTKNLVKEANSSVEKFASAADISKVQNKLDSLLNKSNLSSGLEKELKDLKAEFNSFGDSVKTEDLERFRKKLQAIEAQVKSTGTTFGEQYDKLFSSVVKVGSITTVLREAWQVAKKMATEVMEIDKAMVDVKKVTDESDSRYSSYLDDSKTTAKELGRSISSYVEQTASWAKLGYSLNEAEELAKISSIYSNVAEVDNDTAVSDIVTALKAYNIEAENAISVTDALNELGNDFATSAGELGQGLSNSASAMENAGTDLYKTLAMLTGGAEITQDAGEFGNFLKTASMRIRGMKGELEELGEEIDESVDSISKVQTQILNLTHGQVNIFDDTGAFRDYYDIMKDISDVYDSLSSTDQASLSEILFGKQRGNQGSALIKAFQSGQIQKAYETALNSSGSMQAEQDKWMEGIEAKTEQLKASWQSLSETVVNSDFLGNLVEDATTLLEITEGIVENIGTGTTLFGIGTLGFGIKNLGKTFAHHGCESMAA